MATSSGWAVPEVIDGTVIILPDTEANQAAYPQAHSQQPGLGFPVLRLVALVCLGSGAVCDAALGPCVGKGGDDGARLHPLMILMAQPRVALRPRPIERRLVKRRRKRFGLMMQPREQARAQAGASGRDVGLGGFVLEQLGYGAAVVLSTVFISMFAHGLSAAPGIAFYAARSSPTSPDRSEP
jgi:hypothetical protein